MKATRILHYVTLGVENLIENGQFYNGASLRPTQAESLEYYKNFLRDERLSALQRLTGFFELFTSAGKTALLAAIIDEAHAAALEDGIELKSAIVVAKRIHLKQTKDDIEKFTPRLSDQVGFYGGGRKNLEMPLTIMTYNAFEKLSKTGEISPKNIHILVADEGHKGTSERRLETLEVTFNGAVRANANSTVQLAFTATAEFDEMKSVYQSHTNKIFGKSIREGMLEGADELAAYVQGQTVIIRVPPDDFLLSDEFKNAAVEDQISYRKRLKQDHWNAFALEAFKEGRDDHSGNLFTDNQAAFFVDGIDQGIKLEEMLNQDPELQRRAAERGFSSVAAVIHSKQSDKEQDARIEAYRNNEYLAIIGDEIFKEGFNYLPLKTVFDYSHGSKVDKGQIIGRGTRAWFNPYKQRNEGLAFVDTIIYIGSNNKETDKRLRKVAMLKAVSLKQILGDTYILNPGKAEKRVEYAPYPPRQPFGDDLNIEYYASVEDMYRLDNEIEKIRAGFTMTMEDVIATADAHVDIEGAKGLNAGLGVIEHGPLAGIMTWASYDNALKTGRYGLKDDPLWQELSAKWSQEGEPHPEL